MSYRLIPYLFGLLITVSSVSADTVGFTFGAALWNHGPDGDLAYAKSGVATEIDFDETLDLSTDMEGFFWLSIEHPVPIFPNVKLQRTSLNTEGRKVLTQPVRFGNTTYNIGTAVDSEVSLDQTDVMLYYEVLDNIFNLDLGLNVKIINADFNISSSLVEEDESLTLYVPMIYGAARFELPLSGAYLGGAGSLLSYSGSSYSDYRLNIGYESELGLGVEGGYRAQRIKLDDVEDISADFQFSGAYFGVFYHF